MARKINIKKIDPEHYATRICLTIQAYMPLTGILITWVRGKQYPNATSIWCSSRPLQYATSNIDRQVLLKPI